ncbi:hypothetical protein MMON44395_05325 [Mycolicibacterium monacense DSM 44395]|nr:hypothetical protein [Mycolicibacterium monacense DSM 44395]
MVSMMTTATQVDILADHPIWIAVPAFAPAIVVAGVVVYIAAKNRQKRQGGRSAQDGAS